MNSSDNTENDVILSQHLLIFKATAFGILICLNVCFNTFTLMVLRRMRDLKPATRVLLTSMTVGDIVSLIYHIPVFISTIVNDWPFGSYSCTVLGLAGVLVNILYYFNLPVVNLERYIAVAYPYKYPSLVTVSRARAAVVSIWGFAVSCAIIVSYGSSGTTSYVQIFHACFLQENLEEYVVAMRQKDFKVIITTTISWLIPVIPLTVSFGLFLRLYLIAKKHAAQIVAQENLGNNNPPNGLERKTFVTFFIMTLCLTISVIPHIVSHFWNFLLREVNGWFACVAQIMFLSNTILNVVVYYLRTNSFRQAIRKLFKC